MTISTLEEEGDVVILGELNSKLGKGFVFLGEERPVKDLSVQEILDLPLVLLLEVMDRHIGKSHVQVAGCISLAMFAADKEVNLDSFHVLFRVLIEHPGEPLVQRLGCKALKVMSDSQSLCAGIAETGVDTVHSAMRHADGETQRWCCGALSNLTTLHSCRKRCVELCVVESLCGAMRYDDEELQQWCLATLQNLTLTKAGSREIVCMNGETHIHHALRRYPENDNVQRLGRSLLQRLALHGTGGTYPLAVMRRDDVRSQRNGCRALAGLGDAERRRMVALGGIDAVKAAMGRHPRDLPVQLWSCRALHNLMYDEESRDEVGDFNGIRLIHGALWTFPKDLELQQSGLDVLAKLVSSQAIGRRVGDLNGVEVVLGAMVQFRADTVVQELGLTALSLLTHSDDALMKIKYLEGEILVEQAMRQLSSSETSTIGRKTLNKLARAGSCSKL